MIVSLTQNGPGTQTGRGGNCLDLTKGVYGKATGGRLGTSRDQDRRRCHQQVMQHSAPGALSWCRAENGAQTLARVRSQQLTVKTAPVPIDGWWTSKARSICRWFELNGGAATSASREPSRAQRTSTVWLHFCEALEG